jgi:hypothetical protein
MEAFVKWLNEHHLLYFWTVARERGVSKRQRISACYSHDQRAQVRMLEDTSR